MATPQASDVAVDIGAGTGLLTLPVAQAAQQVWAIDISPAMCEYLRARVASAGLENVELASASAASLPLVDGCADLVVSTTAFTISTTTASDVRWLKFIACCVRVAGLSSAT